MVLRWIRSARDYLYELRHDPITTFMGAEFTGHLGEVSNILHTHQSRPCWEDQLPCPVEFVTFGDWLAKADASAIFTLEEQSYLGDEKDELIQAVEEEATERLIQKYMVS